ncbi:ethanolamine utilization protein EutN [Pontibacillus yanchengensis]|uniref:Ethanolamine utilization protein EutN n=2 Tax=Pontibacillus yanchengensis TaxID=462910 RepID=A0ACC7VMF7_9BACI|nr:EutN/CcmL family microcompartment protein [Pontibacillus yanchengensis]MYL35768.1 ethanolamine utilization protein EutN [Pontibacillus yanchengensis]MYL55479.1 ethanolamine utilization protein EutN [Pontibacillus yanchengensis]
MIVGKVVGNIWATRKEEGLTGLKFLLVKPDPSFSYSTNETFVAVDRIGAGTGDQVMVTTGSASSHLQSETYTPIDALIIGIIDSLELERSEDDG